MIHKIYNKLDWIICAAIIVIAAIICYGLGSESRTNKLCKQLGGVYVQTWSDGHACIHATEISLK